MAKVVLNNAKVTINAVDLSDHIASVSLNVEVADVPTTAMGATSVSRVGGLQDNSIQIDFHQDFAASSVEATIFPLIGTLTAVVIKQSTAVTSATNPQYTSSCLVTNWAPVAGAVGELLTASVTWPVSGDIAKAVV